MQNRSENVKTPDNFDNIVGKCFRNKGKTYINLIRVDQVDHVEPDIVFTPSKKAESAVLCSCTFVKISEITEKTQKVSFSTGMRFWYVPGSTQDDQGKARFASDMFPIRTTAYESISPIGFQKILNQFVGTVIDGKIPVLTNYDWMHTLTPKDIAVHWETEGLCLYDESLDWLADQYRNITFDQWEKEFGCVTASEEEWQDWNNEETTSDDKRTA